MNTHTNNPQGGAERDPGNIHSSSEAAHAEFKMIMDEAEAARTSKEDIFAKLLAWGVHPEIVFRLERIWEYTKRVGERIIHVGQLVLAKIIEFIEANPQMLIGAALGAAIGILASGIPVLGPLLAPISVLLGAGFGAIVGHVIWTARTKDSLPGMVAPSGKRSSLSWKLPGNFSGCLLNC